MSLVWLFTGIVLGLFLAYTVRPRHKHRWSDWDTYVLKPGGVPVMQTKKCRVSSCSKIKKRKV